MQPNELIQQIPLPEQTIKKLSFCSSNKPQRVAEWASLLRPTQINQTSVMLYKALPEVNRLKTTQQARFSMLESLRPCVQNTIHGLSKGFLHQPLALPEEAQKSAIVAQALQKYMVDGYVLCIQACIKNRKMKANQEDVFYTSLHRAITGIGLLFMRSYQIYTQPAKGLWLTLHALFQIADAYELLDQRVTDENQQYAKVTSIQNAYMRIILLASARPHQLSQNDVAAIYNVFSEWADLLRFTIELTDDPDCFYYVNLHRDAGPLYKSRVGDDEKDNLLIELQLNALLNQLTKQSRNAIGDIDAAALKIPREISASVLQHLLDIWSNISQRKQERRPIKITADICIGLSDCHYFLCNGQKFERFIRNSSTSSELDDIALAGFTPKDTYNPTNKEFERPFSRLEVQNISNGGYCLLWKSSTPLKIESGDLVGIKEFGKRLWAIGVVRWIRQKKQSSQLGVQLLSDHAKPYALSQTYDMGGESDLMRALFLPQSQFSNSPPSLITSSAPFQEQDRVKVFDGNDTSTAKLDECLFLTSCIQRFSFHTIDGGKKPAPKTQNASKW